MSLLIVCIFQFYFLLSVLKLVTAIGNFIVTQSSHPGVLVVSSRSASVYLNSRLLVCRLKLFCFYLACFPRTKLSQLCVIQAFYSYLAHAVRFSALWQKTHGTI